MTDKYISGEEHQAIQSTAKHSHGPTISSHPAVLVATALIILVIGFFAGLNYQKHHSKSLVSTSAASNAPGRFGGGVRRGGIGQVTAVSGTSITINNQRTGASTTYSITSSTTITDNGQTVSVSDIQTGDNVLVTPSGTGSTTATRILVNPSFGGGAGGAQPGSSGSSQTN